MNSVIHPYFFLINTDEQNKILSSLDNSAHEQLLILGVNLLGLDKTILTQAKDKEQVSELLSYISNLCSLEKSLSNKVVLSILAGESLPLSIPAEEIEKTGGVVKKSSVSKKACSTKIRKLKITPNKEQENIVNNCHHGIQVDAFAGSGKSTVSRLIIDELGDNGSIYTAFLKENINDAKSKITSNAHTQDSLACKFALEKAPFKDIFAPGHFSNIYKMKDVVGFDIRFDIGSKKIKQHGVAKLINDTISAYCISCDMTMLDSHVPPQVTLPESRQKLLKWARCYWDYLMSGRATSEHTTTFHHLMKFWSLSPFISMSDEYQNIIVDEAQDINGAFYKVIKNHDDRNLIVIGDAYQQLFKWRGAINSMGLFDKEKYPLTTSYRFGSAIANCSNNILSRHSVPPTHALVGQDSIKSKVTFYDDDRYLPNLPGAILTRTRSKIITIADDELSIGNKIHIKTEIGPLKFVVKNIVYLANDEIDKVTHPYLAKLPSFRFLESELEDTPEPDVYFGLKLYEKYKNNVIDVIERIERNNSPEHEATKIISTTHSIKGQEWDSVVIASDYSYILDNENVDLDSELSVLYVAITRAKKAVYIPCKLKKYFE